jgi:ferredoxin
MCSRSSQHQPALLPVHRTAASVTAGADKRCNAGHSVYTINLHIALDHNPPPVILPLLPPTSKPSLQSSLAIKLDREKCIKCMRCVTTCSEVQGMNVLGAFSRGRERHIGFLYGERRAAGGCVLGAWGWHDAHKGPQPGPCWEFRRCSTSSGAQMSCSGSGTCPAANRLSNSSSPPVLPLTPPPPPHDTHTLPPTHPPPPPPEDDMALSKCISCGQCVSVCPVGALSERSQWRQVLEELGAKRKVGGQGGGGQGLGVEKGHPQVVGGWAGTRRAKKVKGWAEPHKGLMTLLFLALMLRSCFHALWPCSFVLDNLPK